MEEMALLEQADRLSDYFIFLTAHTKQDDPRYERFARLRGKSINRYARRWRQIGGAVVVNAVKEQERANKLLKAKQ